jgi:hypothetical protein
MACTLAGGRSVAAISQKDCKCVATAVRHKSYQDEAWDVLWSYISYTLASTADIVVLFRTGYQVLMNEKRCWFVRGDNDLPERLPTRDLQPSCPISLNFVLVSFRSLYLIWRSRAPNLN